MYLSLVVQLSTKKAAAYQQRAFSFHCRFTNNAILCYHTIEALVRLKGGRVAEGRGEERQRGKRRKVEKAEKQKEKKNRGRVEEGGGGGGGVGGEGGGWRGKMYLMFNTLLRN